jgi:hypothetical protein
MKSERREFLAATAAVGIGALTLAPGQARSDAKAKEFTPQ